MAVMAVEPTAAVMMVAAVGVVARAEVKAGELRVEAVTAAVILEVPMAAEGPAAVTVEAVGWVGTWVHPSVASVAVAGGEKAAGWMAAADRVVAREGATVTAEGTRGQGRMEAVIWVAKVEVEEAAQGCPAE